MTNAASLRMHSETSKTATRIAHQTKSEIGAKLVAPSPLATKQSLFKELIPYHLRVNMISVLARDVP